MSPPLPHSLAAPPQRPPSAHSGLWFDKFCHQWSDAWRLDSPAKLNWIQTVTGSRVGDEKLISEHVARYTALARASGGEVQFFKTAGRFATGLGREHPIENGFVWHPTLGVPCLPGSSVKGFVRAWAKTWAGASDEDVARIFGPRDMRASLAQTGSLIFFGAIPIKPVQLAADVMTPHYGPYYEDKSGKTAPGDWFSPVPIPFLSVADGQSFVFALAPRTFSTQDKADCQQANKWLTEALLQMGAGAKTAVGYGRFVPDAEAALGMKKAEEVAQIAAREAEEKAVFAAGLASLSPLARELRQAAHDQKWETDGNAFKAPNIVENWLQRVEADPQPDATAHLRSLFDRHFPGLLANPDKTEGKKNKPAFKPRWVALAKRLNSLPKP